MREIKFRAWDKHAKQMAQVDMILFSTGEIDCAGSMDEPKSMEHFEIMQFTGLKDKNGKEIYEGDIVKCHYFYEALGENLGVYEAEKIITGEIATQELGLWIETNNEDESGYLLFINLHEESFEIIGNIHENPELL